MIQCAWSFYFFSGSVSSVMHNLPAVFPYHRISEKKSFVYRESSRSMLTHPPLLLVSQHNGWTTTKHKNQSKTFSSHSVHPWLDRCSHLHHFSNKTHIQTTKKNIKKYIKVAEIVKNAQQKILKTVNRWKPYLGVGVKSHLSIQY